MKVLNLNDIVKVQLTEAGKAHYLAYLQSCKLNKELILDEMDKIDDQNYLPIQLHSLRVLGDLNTNLVSTYGLIDEKVLGEPEQSSTLGL